MANESLSTWRQISWCLNKSIVYFSGAPAPASRSVSRAGNLLYHSSCWGWLSTSCGCGQEGRAHPVTFLQMSSVLLGKLLTALLMVSPVPFLLHQISHWSRLRKLCDQKVIQRITSTFFCCPTTGELFNTVPFSPHGNSSLRLVILGHDPALLTGEGCFRI